MKAHCLPFSQIPHTTRLFADYLAYAPSVQPFYPRSPYLAEWVKEEAAGIRYDSERRERIVNILDRQNKSWGASAKTLSNIDRLRKGAAAVVTGQQVGLFGGPTFSLYKALTAVKLAEEATAAGPRPARSYGLQLATATRRQRLQQAAASHSHAAPAPQRL